MKKNETACQAKCQPVMLPVMPKSRHMQTPFGVIFMPNHANHAKQPKAWENEEEDFDLGDTEGTTRLHHQLDRCSDLGWS